MQLATLQEDLSVLLCFSDKYAKVIRGSVDVGMYSGPYRQIATAVYSYLDRYGRPPKEHIADLLEVELGDATKGSIYTDIVTSIHEASANINEEYVINRLETFVKRQAFRAIAIEATNALKRDTEEGLDEAYRLFTKAQDKGLKVFDPGTRLSDKTKALAFLDISDSAYPLGIPELDKRGFGPTPKELWLFIANAKRGKSWALIHLAKMATAYRLKVVHISLEMSEARCAQRYFQAMFAIGKRKETYRATKFRKDELGRIIGLDDITINPRLTLDDPEVRTKLEGLIEKWALRQLNNIIIKQFPTGQLTVPKLKAYLDNLEQTEKFVPDILIVDYPDLMKLSKSEIRLSLDEIYKDIRGIAVERNIAVAVVSQGHRGSAKAKQVGAENVAEAYSKIAHADCVITYSQTDAENKLGLARLHVAAGRNDEDRITVVISQNYGLGAFAIDSALMSGDYWKQLPSGDEDEDNSS